MRTYRHHAIAIALAILGIVAPLHAQTPVTIAPTMKLQFFSNAGLPLANGCLSSFAAGTSNPQATYTDSTGTAQNTNPVILDAAGRADVWITAQSYKFVLKSAGGVNCASGVQLWSEDNITGVLGLLSLPNTWTSSQSFLQAIKITATTNQLILGTAPNLTTLNFPAPSGAKSLTFPNITDTMVARTTTDTLTNKTLTAPAITTPTISTPTVNGTISGTAIIGTGNKLPSATTLNPNLPVCTAPDSTLTTTGFCGGLLPQIVYQNFVAASNSSTGVTGMVTAGGTGGTYRFSGYANQVAVGTSCTGSTTIVATVIYTDPNAPGIQTATVSGTNISGTTGTVFNVATTGNGAAGNFVGAFAPLTIRAKAGTLVSWQVIYSLGANCAPGPTYSLYLTLEQTMQ